MGKKDTQYEFEKNARNHSIKSNDTAEIELNTFAERLGFKVTDDPDHKATLLQYVHEHHLNIDWYDKRLEKEKLYKILFSGIGLVLLVSIPVGIYFINKTPIPIPNPPIPNQPAMGLPAQVTAIFAGLLGVHKSVSSWLDQRKVIANFWKASADLKDSLYSLENKWRGKALNNESKKLSDDFVTDITEGIKYARKIATDERQKYFDDYALPSMDLTSYLKK